MDVRLIFETIMGTVIVVVCILLISQAVTRSRRQSPDALKTMNELIEQQGERIAALETARRSDHELIRQLEDDLDEWKEYSRKLVAKLREYTADVPLPPGARTLPEIDPRALVAEIRQKFDTEEIDDLAFRMGIEPDNIAGKTRNTRAQSLVRELAKRRKLVELALLIDELRPTEG